MFWIEFIVLMLIIVWGTRKGGSFLAMAGGIGMLIFVYIFRVTPSDPPITVILIMLAVITAACTMQATGGLDFMVQLAENGYDNRALSENYLPGYYLQMKMMREHFSSRTNKEE